MVQDARDPFVAHHLHRLLALELAYAGERLRRQAPNQLNAEVERLGHAIPEQWLTGKVGLRFATIGWLGSGAQDLG